MARVWFIVGVFIHIVYANEIRNCDECIRKGNTWCKELGSDHCPTRPTDDWCPDKKEKSPPMSTSQNTQSEKQIRLYIGTPRQIDISYDSPDKLNITNISIVRSTQHKTIDLSVINNDCFDSQCTVAIEAIAREDFCFSNGTVHEYAYAKVAIENKPEVTIKYHIACACMCTKDVKVDAMDCNLHGDLSCGMCTCHEGWTGEFCQTKIHPTGEPVPPNKGGNKNKVPNVPVPSPAPVPIPTVPIPVSECPVVKYSPKCNFRGDFSCGVCSCRSDWTGKFCEKQICSPRRGDLQKCENPAKSDVECSGNGYCGECDTCVCYTDREGSQYFDEENYCTDLCMITNQCGNCLKNNTIGSCEESQECYMMTKYTYNESLTQIVDIHNRKVWVNCNETVDSCYVEYWVMRNEEEIKIMVQTSCNNVEAGYVSGGHKVSWIVGILGIIAAVTAVGGVLLWKHLNAVPPLPSNDPGYHNIDAEDCTGENPLYKSPMSSFKNPTYGKW